MKIWRRKHRWNFFCGGGWYKEYADLGYLEDVDTSYGFLNDDAMEVLPLLAADITFVITQTVGTAVTTMPTVTARGVNVSDGFDFNIAPATSGPGGGYDGLGPYLDNTGTPAAGPMNGTWDDGVGAFDEFGAFVGIGLGTYDGVGDYTYDLSGTEAGLTFQGIDNGDYTLNYGPLNQDGTDAFGAGLYDGLGDYLDDTGTNYVGMGFGAYDSNGDWVGVAFIEPTFVGTILSPLEEVGGKYWGAQFTVQPQVDAVNVCNSLPFPDTTIYYDPTEWRGTAITTFDTYYETHVSAWTFDSNIALEDPNRFPYQILNTALHGGVNNSGDLQILTVLASPNRVTITSPPSGWTAGPSSNSITDPLKCWYHISTGNVPENFSGSIEDYVGENAYEIYFQMWRVPVGSFSNYQILRANYTSATSIVAPDVYLTGSGKIYYILVSYDNSTGAQPTLPVFTSAIWPEGYSNSVLRESPVPGGVGGPAPTVITYSTGYADVLGRWGWRLVKPRSGLVTGVTFTWASAIPNCSMLIVALED
jgi:hypothetical protein